MPSGNRMRCRGNCNSLAGKDGWCKHHRPSWATAEDKPTLKAVRDNYLPSYGFHQGPFHNDTFEAVKDHFDCEEGY